MILHTPVPYSEIFPETPREMGKVSPIPSGMIETDDDKILDVFSTDPADHLRYIPGMPIGDPAVSHRQQFPGFPTGNAPGFPTGKM